MDKKIVEYVLGEAAKSNVEKRQVGAIIVAHHDDGSWNIISRGYNVNEQVENDTPMGPVKDCISTHAEAMACEELFNKEYVKPEGSILVCYVSHPPCPNCATLLAEHGVSNTEIVEAFMKFDGDKTRYDLIDPEFSLNLQRECSDNCSAVITGNLSYVWLKLRRYQLDADKSELILLILYLFGYNAKLAERKIAEVLTFGARKYKPNNWRKCTDTGRYLAACFRHLADWEAKGEIDEESGMEHRAHLATNLMFLFCLGYKND